jgi:hypothetical protein
MSFFSFSEVDARIQAHVDKFSGELESGSANLKIDVS